MYLYNFNSCCSGQWSSTINKKNYTSLSIVVLILVVVDDGLVLMVIKVE